MRQMSVPSNGRTSRLVRKNYTAETESPGEGGVNIRRWSTTERQDTATPCVESNCSDAHAGGISARRALRLHEVVEVALQRLTIGGETLDSRGIDIEHRVMQCPTLCQHDLQHLPSRDQ